MLLENALVTKQIRYICRWSNKRERYGEAETDGQIEGAGANPVQATIQRESIHLFGALYGRRDPQGELCRWQTEIRVSEAIPYSRTNAGGQGEERSDARPCQSDSEQTDRRGAKRCARIPEHEQVPSEPARLSGKYREAVR